MDIRIGTVTNTYPSTGRVKVMYEDENNASLNLAMLTMNQELSMPQVGDQVLTIHMENGSSKGFVLGTYYGGEMQPKSKSGYRKDFTKSAHATCSGGTYSLIASKVKLLIGEEDTGLVLDSDTSIKATSVTVEAEDITLSCSYGTITVEDMMKRLERIEDQLGLPHTV